MITNPKDTKKIIKDYWNGVFETTRIDNYPHIQELFHGRMLKRWKNSKLFCWISSHTLQYNTLFRHRVRRAGEYSWNYQYVLDYTDKNVINGKLRIIVYTEKGKGSGYEYVSGRKDLIVPFLMELSELVQSKFAEPNEKPN